jgi:PAS domain S-box-containing protein
MSPNQPVNILLVDDQPAKLLSYEAVLRELGENLLKANSAQEAFEHLLKADIAVVLVDVCMPELDGFELARMIREHPRFQETAIIFVSAVLLTDLDFLRGYAAGAVDYVSVPVVPEILRAKVKIFAELHRKTRQLEQLNRQLEQRVSERTAALEASGEELRKSEERLRLALDAAQMGWWDYDFASDRVVWSANLARIMGFAPQSFGERFDGLLAYVHPEDRDRFVALVKQGIAEGDSQSCELRFLRPDGSIRWSLVAGNIIRDIAGQPVRFAGVDLDISARKQAEERQSMLVREVDHRAKNLLAVVQSVLHLSRADTATEFVAAVEGRIRALARAHTLLSESRWHGVDFGHILNEEIAPFSTGRTNQVAANGPEILLRPATAQSLALALHELTTNAAKYGALSLPQGRLSVTWELQPEAFQIHWLETGGPPTTPPSRRGFGTKVIAGSIEGQLQGRSTFEWRPAGLYCSLTIPRSNVEPHATIGAVQQPQSGQVAPPMAIAGRKLLLVEDEALIGAMMKDALTNLGFIVFGPLSTVTEALAAASDGRFDVAILDINLAEFPIYPVADALAARQIPFIFLTGYGLDAVDPRFSHIPVLEKPVQPETLRQLLLDHSNVAELADAPRASLVASSMGVSPRS